MVHHPYVYAELLKQKMLQHGAQLLAGQHRLDRRPVRHRQAHLASGTPARCSTPRSTASSTTLPTARTRSSASRCPEACEGVPSEILEPANTWGSRREYFQKYDALAARYIENFKLFASGCPPEVLQAGPKRWSGTLP